MQIILIDYEIKRHDSCLHMHSVLFFLIAIAFHNELSRFTTLPAGAGLQQLKEMNRAVFLLAHLIWVHGPCDLRASSSPKKLGLSPYGRISPEVL